MITQCAFVPGRSAPTPFMHLCSLYATILDGTLIRPHPFGRRVWPHVRQTFALFERLSVLFEEGHASDARPSFQFSRDYSRNSCIVVDAIPDSTSHSLMFAPITSGWSSCK